ncbi:MAG: TolC family protein [Planctomycetaceae bacterium]|nr:TolC family protein [Planctomycetaceae bacterium]
MQASAQIEAPPAPAPLPSGSTQSPDAAPVDSPASDFNSGMTLEQALGMAMANNPTIAQAQASVHRSQGEWSQSGFYPNPTLYYVGSELGQQDQVGQQGVYVTQNIVTADKLRLNRAVAAGDIAASRAQVDAQRLRVHTDTTVRFYRALGAQQQVTITRQIERNAEEGLAGTRELLRAGQITEADELQAGILLQQSAITRQQAEVAAEAAWRELAVMLGLPQLAPALLVGEWDRASDAVADFETAWFRLKESSPELRAASARVARTRAKVGREEAQAVPNIDAQFSVQQDVITNYTIGYAQVGIAVPIHHQNQGSIAAAQAGHVRACRDYERLELQLRDRLTAAYRQAESARVAVTRYRDSVLPSASRNLELTRVGYTRGEFDLLRLLTAQRTFAETNVAYVAAQVELQSAAARIDGLLLSGGLDEPPPPQSVGTSAGLADVPRAD